MHLAASTLLLASFFSAAFATPVRQKRYDLDGNGIPDLCDVDSNGIAHCLTDEDTWTTFATATYKTPATPAPVPRASAIPADTAAAPPAAKPHGSLPSVAKFQSENGTKWSVKYVGNIAFTGTMGKQKLGGDKCRSSVVGGRVIWNCGDMECGGGWTVCGFSMGPAFYGTDSVMTIDASAHTNVNDYLFANAWSKDPAPEAPYNSWGMDTTNVAPVNKTHGVAYGWEIWRGGVSTISNRGLAVVSVTLGKTKPIATRIGPLITDGKGLAVGLIAIMAAEDYIYSYSGGGPSSVVVGRVPIAHDAAFAASNYEFLQYSSNPSAKPKWVKGIPAQASKQFGATTAQAGGNFGCGVYGSAFYNNYLQKYMLVCDADMWFMNFFVAENPWGPWSAQYQILKGVEGYGTMAHPEFSPGGSHKELYISQGPDGPFNMFKVTFDY